MVFSFRVSSPNKVVPVYYLLFAGSKQVALLVHNLAVAFL